jgi:hypothetical protein
MEKVNKEKSSVVSCANCRWVACKNYGYENKPTCIHFIKDK